jgi:hypothetical protein
MSAIGDQRRLPLHAFTLRPERVDADAIEAPPAGAALLTVKRGPTVGSRFVLDRHSCCGGQKWIDARAGSASRPAWRPCSC